MNRMIFFSTVFIAALALSVQTGLTAQEAGTDAAPVQGEHNVVKGDTLWDISGAYLNDPFLWPEVWKANPEIDNPHLIYPGDKVRLPGFAEGAPAGEEGVSQQEGEPEKAAGAAHVKSGKLPFEEEPFVDISKTLIRVPEEKEKRVISLDEDKEAKRPVATLGGILAAGFISEDGDERLNIIGSPMGEREIFSFGDEVYILPNENLKPGDKLVSFRVEDDVDHPATGDDLGELLKITGLLVVVGEREGYLLCRVSKTVNEIRPTDILMPYTEPGLVYEPVPRNIELKGEWGYIVAAQELRELNATAYAVYLDLGSADHVKPGDTFVVRRSGGSVRAKQEGHYYLVDKEFDLPSVDVGEVQVISVRDRTSTARVTNFSEPLTAGQRVYYKD